MMWTAAKVGTKHSPVGLMWVGEGNKIICMAKNESPVHEKWLLKMWPHGSLVADTSERLQLKICQFLFLFWASRHHMPVGYYTKASPRMLRIWAACRDIHWTSILPLPPTGKIFWLSHWTGIPRNNDPISTTLSHFLYNHLPYNPRKKEKKTFGYFKIPKPWQIMSGVPSRCSSAGAAFDLHSCSLLHRCAAFHARR